MTRLGGVVLAAGASVRAGGAKALATLDGETFVARAARVLREAGCDEVIVVVGPPHGARIAAALDGARLAHNDAPERGMLSTLRTALEQPIAAAWDGAVIALVDQPRVRAETVRRLVEVFVASGAELVRPRCAGRRGHPYVISRAVFGPLCAAPDEHGARPVLAALPRAVDVDVVDPGVLEDLDRRTDLLAAGAHLAR